MKRFAFVNISFFVVALFCYSLASAAAAPCGINHQFVSAKADSADTTIVRPVDWNADHNCDADAFGPTQIDETANYTWTGQQDFSGAVIPGGTPLVFEGATANDFETSLAIADPTADRTVRIPDASGTVAFKGDTVFSASDYDFSTTDPSAVTTVGVKNPIYFRPVLSKIVAGALAGANYKVRISYTNAAGETRASATAVLSVDTNSELVIASPPASTNATGWNVYVDAAGSVETRQNGGTPIAIGTNYTLTAVVAGAAIPTTNSTGATTVTPAAFANSSNFTSFYAPVNQTGVDQQMVHFQPILIDDGGANEEVVFAESVSGSTFSAVFTKTHSAGYTIKSATGGIAEAVLAIGAQTGLSDPPYGGTILLPFGRTTLDAPVPIRQRVKYLGRGGPRGGGDTGGTTTTSQIVFSSLDDQQAAFFSPGIIGTNGSTGVEFRNFEIFSNTGGIRVTGSLGGDMGFVVDGMRINANLNGLVSGTSAISAGYGSVYTRITNSWLGGSPVIKITGSIMIDFIMRDTRLDTRLDDGANNTAMTIVANAGGNAAGMESGAGLTLSNIVTEGGDRELFNFEDVNALYFRDSQFADWNATGAVSYMKMKTRYVGDWNLFFENIVFSNANANAVSSIDLSSEAGSFARYAKFDNIRFNPQAPAISANSITGPITITNSHSVDASLTSGAGSVTNPPSLGILYWGNRDSNEFALASRFSKSFGTNGTGHLIPNAANTYDLCDSTTTCRSGYFGTLLRAPTINATTGFQLNGGAASGNVLRGNGTNFVSAQLAFTDLSGSPAHEEYFAAATCNNVTATLAFNANTANVPAATCEGTNTRLGTADFDDTTDEGFDGQWRLPTGFTGAIDIIVRGKAAAITGAVGICFQMVRVPTGATSDPALPAQAAGNCVSFTIPGTTLQEVEATITGVTCTSCVAGDRVNWKLTRDADGGAVTDSMTGDFKLLGFTRRWRVTPQS